MSLQRVTTLFCSKQLVHVNGFQALLQTLSGRLLPYSQTVRAAPLQLVVQHLLAQAQQLWAGKKVMLGSALANFKFLLRDFANWSK